MEYLIVAITVFIVYAVEKWEHKAIQSFLDWIPAILLAYVVPALVSLFFGLDYSSKQIHTISKDWLIPLAIVAVMSSLSFQQLRAVGWKPILLFFSGSMWIALFPVLGFWLFFKFSLGGTNTIPLEYWKGTVPIVGSWIGGSTSQLVLKELAQCPEDMFLSVLVMDNVLVNIWTVLMFQGIKQSDRLNRWLKIKSAETPKEIEKGKKVGLHGFYSVAILLVTVLITNLLLKDFVVKILVLSIIGLFFSNFVKSWNISFVLRLGSITIVIIMAILGLKLQLTQFNLNAYFFLFLVIWLISHFGFMLMVSKILNVNAAWIPIASMANVGGIATAPAVTSAYEPKWMPHAIILAILSMATGTFWGMITIFLFQNVLSY